MNLPKTHRPINLLPPLSCPAFLDHKWINFSKGRLEKEYKNDVVGYYFGFENMCANFAITCTFSSLTYMYHLLFV